MSTKSSPGESSCKSGNAERMSDSSRGYQVCPTIAAVPHLMFLRCLRQSLASQSARLMHIPISACGCVLASVKAQSITIPPMRCHCSAILTTSMAVRAL